MTVNYEVVTSEMGTVTIVKTETDSDIVTLIPVDLANADYQAYLNKDKPVEHFTPIVTDEAKTK